MADGRSSRSKQATHLAVLRLELGLTQERLALATGIPLATYKRLEQGKLKDPSIRYLLNCAMALECELEDLIEFEWNDWTVFPGGPKAPPPSGWWKKPERYVFELREQARRR